MSFNRKIHVISSKELIGEFLIDFDMQQTSFIGLLNRHIVRAIELMRIDVYYTQTVCAFTTEECRTPVPCNSKYIQTVVLDAGDNCPIFLDLTNHGLRLLNSDNLAGQTETYGYADGGYINFKDFDGRGLILYRSLPKDKEDYVLIPNDPFLKEAVLMFLIAKLGLSGYVHKVVSREEAEAKWANLHPQARNSVNFPSIEDMEVYTNRNTNPLFNNIRRIDTKDGSFDAIPNISLLDAYPNSVNKFYDFDELSAAFGIDE